MQKHPAILVINAGSSSIKFSVFETGERLILRFSGQVDALVTAPVFSLCDAQRRKLEETAMPDTGHEAALRFVMARLEGHLGNYILTATGHRIVHGGTQYTSPVIITEAVFTALEALIPLAPLHQPHNLAAVNILKTMYPHLPHVACFDTAFHASQPRLARLFPLPRRYAEEGILRYGFHGLSYDYITSVLPAEIGGRVIIAHLGNGASLCAVRDGKSIATTMGFTALDGLIMGTRPGAIDPGVLLYLMEQKGYSAGDINHLLYKESGLLGVSGISHDMRELEQSNAPEAKEAIALFCYRAAREIGSLVAALGGLDALVFTAGIGEKSALVRQKIIEYSAWLGIEIDAEKNSRHADSIHMAGSTVTAWVIPTDEALVVAKYTAELCAN